MSAGTDPGKVSKDFVVCNKLGIHARPAAMFVKVANQFSADVFVEKDGERVNGKSIMGLMMLAAGPQSTVTVEVAGSDSSEAMTQLTDLFDRNFDEE